MRVIASFLLLAAMSTFAAAQTVQRIDIVEFGIYRLEVTKKEAAPGTAAGSVSVVNNIELQDATTTVPARIGTHFGFRYRITGNSGTVYKLKMITVTPGLHNPDTGNRIVRDEYFTEATDGQTRYKGYTFDHPWELVTGAWRFEVFWQGSRM